MPIVTISRQYGAGGSAVAERVARALEWPLLDSSFVDRVAERLGVAREEISSREERLPTLAERLIDSLAFSSPELLPPVSEAQLPPSEERILEVTRRIVEETVAHGPAVVVGRGAQPILGERTDAIHVFCCAPREVLVARIMQRQGIDAAEAESLVDQTNRQREQYVKRNWNRRWLAPENYHLCVNTGWLGIDGAASLIVAVARERFGGTA